MEGDGAGGELTSYSDLSESRDGDMTLQVVGLPTRKLFIPL
jgi:hypothetical protein